MALFWWCKVTLDLVPVTHRHMTVTGALALDEGCPVLFLNVRMRAGKGEGGKLQGESGVMWRCVRGGWTWEYRADILPLSSESISALLPPCSATLPQHNPKSPPRTSPHQQTAPRHKLHCELKWRSPNLGATCCLREEAWALLCATEGGGFVEPAAVVCDPFGMWSEIEKGFMAFGRTDNGSLGSKDEPLSAAHVKRWVIAGCMFGSDLGSSKVQHVCRAVCYRP